MAYAAISSNPLNQRARAGGMLAWLTRKIGCQLFLPLAMKKKPKKKKRGLGNRAANAEATYICDSCGEEIVVPVDISAGAHQDYVEDCPVCCHPMSLHVEIGDDGEAHVEGEHE